MPRLLVSTDLGSFFKSVGFYIGTVLLGLIIHGFITLPLIYFVVTRKNPYKFMIGIFEVIMTALGTSSSLAAMPVTFRVLEQKMGIDKRIVRFCIPIGATINMDGAALYEAVSAIFVAQARHVELDAVKIIIIALTATLASIGTAGIPQGGLVTFIIVLNAVGLPAADVSLMFMVDWFCDRFCTCLNVLGDSYGCAIVAHLSKKDLEAVDEAEKARERHLESSSSKESGIELEPIEDAKQEEPKQEQ